MSILNDLCKQYHRTLVQQEMYVERECWNVWKDFVEKWIFVVSILLRKGRKKQREQSCQLITSITLWQEWSYREEAANIHLFRSGLIYLSKCCTALQTSAIELLLSSKILSMLSSLQYKHHHLWFTPFLILDSQTAGQVGTVKQPEVEGFRSQWWRGEINHGTLNTLNCVNTFLKVTSRLQQFPERAASRLQQFPRTITLFILSVKANRLFTFQSSILTLVLLRVSPFSPHSKKCCLQILFLFPLFSELSLMISRKWWLIVVPTKMKGKECRDPWNWV